MQSAYEQYTSGCRMISALAHQEVQCKESVAANALSVGYSDPNYFSKVFTKLERMTPHDYRFFG